MQPPPLLIDTRRGIECIGPVFDGDSITGHTTDWRWDRIIAQAYGNRGWAWTWFETTFPVASLYKMRPIRFACKASTDYYGAGSGGPSKRQMSNLSPPATSDGHFSGSIIDELSYGAGLIDTQRGNSASKIVATRLLVDGVDVTGIVAANVGMTVIPGGVIPFGGIISGALTITTSPVAVPNASTIWLDLWVENRLRGVLAPASYIISSEATGITDANAGPIITATGSLGGVYRSDYTPTMTSGKINVHRRLSLSDRWQLTFTGGTVGGAAALVMESQTGWAFLRNGPLVSMTKTTGAGAGDQVTFRYDTETPEIMVRLQSQYLVEQGSAGGQFTGRMRYSILSPSYYGPVLQSGNAIGPVTASGVNTFVATCRGYYGAFAQWLAIEQTVPAMRTGFPTAITATRI
jgi:hypothetical protein